LREEFAERWERRDGHFGPQSKSRNVGWCVMTFGVADEGFSLA